MQYEDLAAIAIVICGLTIALVAEWLLQTYSDHR